MAQKEKLDDVELMKLLREKKPELEKTITNWNK